MRFLFCDRISTIVKGEYIEGVKAFSLSEEFLNGHFQKRPLVPGAILMETMAQFLGWLIIYTHDFTFFPIISIMEDVDLVPDLVPGLEAMVKARMLSTGKTDSLGKAEILVHGQVVARAGRMIYTHVTADDPNGLKDRFNLMARSRRGREKQGSIRG